MQIIIIPIYKQSGNKDEEKLCEAHSKQVLESSLLSLVPVSVI